MAALVNALKMTYVNLGSVKRGVCKPNDRLRISLLFIRLAGIRLKAKKRAAPGTMNVPLASGGGPGGWPRNLRNRLNIVPCGALARIR